MSSRGGIANFDAVNPEVEEVTPARPKVALGPTTCATTRAATRAPGPLHDSRWQNS